MNATYQETADNHRINPSDAGNVLLTAGAISNPTILSFDASDAIGIKEGQTIEEVRTKLQNALERLSSGDDKTRVRLAEQIDPGFADEMEKSEEESESDMDDDEMTCNILIEHAKDLIRKTLGWLDV